MSLTEKQRSWKPCPSCTSDGTETGLSSSDWELHYVAVAFRFVLPEFLEYPFSATASNALLRL